MLCARMTGQFADGEDVVHTLSPALLRAVGAERTPALRSWLFFASPTIVRSTTCVAMTGAMSETARCVAMDRADGCVLDLDKHAFTRRAVRAAISRFLELAPAQRS